MFNDNDLLEFIGKIINKGDSSDVSVIKDNMTKFRDYLELTKMCSNEVLQGMDIVIGCTDELVALKDKIGSIDISSIIKQKDETKASKEKIIGSKKKSIGQYEDKHYCHYGTISYDTPSYYSSSCGGGSSYRSHC